MGIFDKYLEAFGLVQKEIEEDPMAPKYIKPDGTKVIEQILPEGKVVYEINPDKTLISRVYNKSDDVYMDYIRKGNFEIGHHYDESGFKVYEFEAAYSGGKIVKRNEKLYTYHENGQIASEFYFQTPEDVRIQIKYDDTGKKTEKIEQRGSVKTFFDANDKPVKREIDRGSGGIITEDLTK